MIYQKDSSKAEEFIHHEEILDTLEYAQNNKDNRVLIEQLIEKAALCKGLTHREAAILLECNQPDLIERIFHLAKEIKQKFYGNRIVMFAPISYSRRLITRTTTKHFIPPVRKAIMPITPKRWTVPWKGESMM